MCGGRQVTGKTTFSVDLGFGLVVVRSVPATVCEVCGEDFIEDKVAAVLEKLVDEARKHQRTIEVMHYEKEIQYPVAS